MRSGTPGNTVMQRRGLSTRHTKNIINSGPRKHFCDEISDMSHKFFSPLLCCSLSIPRGVKIHATRR